MTALFTVTPSQNDIETVLRSFLLGVLPSGIDVIRGQVNRVPEPREANFVVVTAIRRERIETNVPENSEATYTASIAGSAMTVSAIAGELLVGDLVNGSGVAEGTAIVSGSGTGIGTYTVSIPQSLSARSLYSGRQSVTQPTKITFQLDVHGPDSADNAEAITTLFRDEYAVDAFTALSPFVTPLHADDPKQAPFIDAESQYETRWIIEALVQANQTITVPLQSATTLEAALVEVDASFPP